MLGQICTLKLRRFPKSPIGKSTLCIHVSTAARGSSHASEPTQSRKRMTLFRKSMNLNLPPLRESEMHISAMN